MSSGYPRILAISDIVRNAANHKPPQYALKQRLKRQKRCLSIAICITKKNAASMPEALYQVEF